MPRLVGGPIKRTSKEVRTLSDRKQEEKTQRRHGYVDDGFVQYMEGDQPTLTGGNVAYGNAPRNMGVRTTPVMPEEPDESPRG